MEDHMEEDATGTTEIMVTGEDAIEMMTAEVVMEEVETGMMTEVREEVTEIMEEVTEEVMATVMEEEGISSSELSIFKYKTHQP